MGFIRLPEDRAASDRVSGDVRASRTGARSSILFHEGHARGHLDEVAIVPDQLVPLLREQLPVEVGPAGQERRGRHARAYRVLLTKFVRGELPEERFQWGYLERLANEALWRDDETFALLNSLFENEWGRDVRAARLVAVEFQGQLAGRLEPLKDRAARLLERLSDRTTTESNRLRRTQEAISQIARTSGSE